MFSGSIHFAPPSGARSSDRRRRIASGISMAVNSRGMLQPFGAGRLLGAGALDQLLDGGQDRLVISATPRALGCRPSSRLSLASSATPSRKNG